jgi:hypothetical protein
MRHDWTDPEPTPEQLAAYADGELDASARDAMAAWLARCPAAAREVEAWQRLDRLFQGTAPAEPAPPAWIATRDRIAAGMRVKRRPSGPWWAAGVAAASVLLALFLGKDAWQPPVTPVPVETPYPVAEADEISILSMDPDDTVALVVGTPPIVGPIDLARAEDITLVEARAHQEDEEPAQLWPGDGGGPMIVPTDPRDR